MAQWAMTLGLALTTSRGRSHGTAPTVCRCQPWAKQPPPTPTPPPCCWPDPIGGASQSSHPSSSGHGRRPPARLRRFMGPFRLEDRDPTKGCQQYPQNRARKRAKGTGLGAGAS